MRKLYVIVIVGFVLVVIYSRSQQEGVFDDQLNIKQTTKTTKEIKKIEELKIAKVLNKQVEDIVFKIPELDRVSEEIKLIAGLSLASKNYAKRNKAVHQLKNIGALKEEDYQALNSFLISYPSKELENSLWLHSLKNDVLVFLVEEDKRTVNDEDLQTMFVQVLNDKKQSAVMRDYVIQFVPRLFDKIYHDAEDDLTVQQNYRKKEIKKALWESLDSKEGAIAGTALLTLEEMSKTDKSISKDKIIEKSLKMIKDKSYTPAAQYAAFDRVAESDSKEGKKFIRDLVFSKEVSTSLKYKAIALSSQWGSDPELLAYLEDEILSNKNKTDKRLVYAAEAAQKRLK